MRRPHSETRTVRHTLCCWSSSTDSRAVSRVVQRFLTKGILTQRFLSQEATKISRQQVNNINLIFGFLFVSFPSYLSFAFQNLEIESVFLNAQANRQPFEVYQCSLKNLLVKRLLGEDCLVKALSQEKDTPLNRLFAQATRPKSRRRCGVE